MSLEKKTGVEFPSRPLLIVEAGQLCARFFNKAYYRPAVLAPWSSDFLSPLVFASLTVSSGFALVRALAGFHLSLQCVQSGNYTELAWRCMEDCGQGAERACHRGPLCAVLATLVTTPQPVPQVKHLTFSLGDQGTLVFHDLSAWPRKRHWAVVLALAWPP